MTAQASFARALLDPVWACPDGLRAWNGSDPATRFAVYRNNVVVALVDALSATFPVCSALVGEAFFRAMAREFVAARPPRSRVLAFYGRDFPAFVDAFAPAESVPYLADVARLEMARLEACHAADVEALAPDEIAAALADPARLPALRIEAHPSAAVLRSRFAVFSLWAAHQGEGAPEIELATVDPAQPQSVLVVRAGLDVHCVELAPAIAVFIDRLLHGAGLATAQHAAHGAGPDFDLVTGLTILLQWQIITALHIGDHHEHPH